MDVHNIYNNANKIFNLYKGLPLSAMTWGLGNIGPASISTLAKDFRARLTGGPKDWKLKPKSYKLIEVAEQFKTFFYDEHYEPFASAAKAKEEDVPGLGLCLAGYSAGEDQPEIFQLDMSPDGCSSRFGSAFQLSGRGAECSCVVLRFVLLVVGLVVVVVRG